MNTLASNLTETARQIRCDIIRMVHIAGSGHPGASLSSVEIVTELYFDEMNIDPQRPDWRERDRFILSKGHACPVQYAALAHRGYFSRDELWKLRQIDSILQGHPDMKKTPGVDMTAGSLGNGLSCGVGMAIGAKMDNLPTRVYVVLGDGETQEGAVWEAAMSAAHYKLDNLVAIVDYNHLQLDGTVHQVMDICPVENKWQSFCWNVVEADGHSFPDLKNAFKAARETEGQPTLVIAHTTKGKGVSFMENACDWHGRWPTPEECKAAFSELGEEF